MILEGSGARQGRSQASGGILRALPLVLTLSIAGIFPLLHTRCPKEIAFFPRLGFYMTAVFEPYIRVKPLHQVGPESQGRQRSGL